MKSCTICGLTKSHADFFFRNKKLNKLHSQCKSCYAIKRRKIWRDHYHKYGSKYRERAVERNRKLKARLRVRMLEFLKDKACAKCGNNDIRVLEFDHLSPSEKTFGIAHGIHNIVRWDRLLAEISKCQILCANCHKIKTAKEQSWYKTF